MGPVDMAELQMNLVGESQRKGRSELASKRYGTGSFSTHFRNPTAHAQMFDVQKNKKELPRLLTPMFCSCII